MREKGKKGKIKIILLRVNKDDKQLAEELSHKAGMSTSEYIRNLLREAKENDHLSLHLKIVEKYEKTLAEYRTLLNESRKNKG